MNFFQNGDLDFDGNSYHAFWPDGSANHPQPFRYAGPFDSGGDPYPSVQLETNVAASEITCNTSTGAGCTALPSGAAFYPFWTIGTQKSPFGSPSPAKAETVCLWNFGNSIPGTTTDDLGGLAEHGTPNLARFGGTLISAPSPNPQLNEDCTR